MRGTQEAIRELLDSTSDPAYSVDEGGALSGWNDAAEQLLGYPREEVFGQPCHEILRGRDVFGNPYCEPDCPLLVMARKRQPVRHFQMDVYGRGGTAKRVLCFVIVIPGSKDAAFSILHLLRPIDRPLSLWPDREEADLPRVTERELEVLRLLAEGNTTQGMAEILNVSTSTIRKHVQNLLRKLGVKSRLAAVLVAIEQGLL